MQFWPILGLIHLCNSSIKSDPFIIGLFSGNEKPRNPEEYLHDFVDEFSHIQCTGIQYKGQVYVVSI